ncbi:MAG: hypothetical protein Q7S74_01550 [Nanoarchaeota archaeon]|nr:hypothetical protein [Nanoarchaeota archaeon]
MELTASDIKFLTIMNETRLCEGKLFKRDSDEIGKVFSFKEKELNSAVKKLVKMGMLSPLDLGGNEVVYFHTEKVPKDKLDKDLIKIKH